VALIMAKWTLIGVKDNRSEYFITLNDGDCLNIKKDKTSIQVHHGVPAEKWNVHNPIAFNENGITERREGYYECYISYSDVECSKMILSEVPRPINTDHAKYLDNIVSYAKNCVTREIEVLNSLLGGNK